MRIEDLKQDARTAVLAAVIARSNGADVEVPDVDEVVDKFNQALAEPPEIMTAADMDRHVLMVALELRDA